MEETNILDAVDKDFDELIHSLEIVGLLISILLPTMLEMNQLTLKGNNPIELIAVLIFSLSLAFAFLLVASLINKKYTSIAIISIVSSTAFLTIILLVTLLYMSALVGSISLSYARWVYWSFQIIAIPFALYILIKTKSIFRHYRNWTTALISALLFSLIFMLIYVVSSTILTSIVPANILDKNVNLITSIVYVIFVVAVFLFLMQKKVMRHWGSNLSEVPMSSLNDLSGAELNNSATHFLAR
jgi:hypothetical protein